ncbi:MAG: hypothetical protein WAV47_19155, partial [Blastocatellia bacterium]
RDESYYEIQSAYRMVGDTAVLKSEALYVSDIAHKLDLTQLKNIARDTWAAQAKAGRRPPKSRLARVQ